MILNSKNDLALSYTSVLQLSVLQERTSGATAPQGYERYSLLIASPNKLYIVIGVLAITAPQI